MPAWNLKAYYTLSNKVNLKLSLEAALKAKELDGKSGEFTQQLFMSKQQLVWDVKSPMGT